MSPSVWWNEHSLLDQLKATIESYVAPLYITVGGDEGDMVEDAVKFSELADQKGIEHILYIALEENHASVIPTTMSKVLRFFYRS